MDEKNLYDVLDKHHVDGLTDITLRPLKRGGSNEKLGPW